jgi:hypothetical protein
MSLPPSGTSPKPSGIGIPRIPRTTSSDPTPRDQDVHDVVQRVHLEQANKRGLEDEPGEAGDDVDGTEDGGDGSNHAHGCVNLQRVLRP